jgi:hypothetical protein
MLPSSLAFYMLSSRGERQLALQRFGAAAGGALQLARRFALQLSSWGGGARITLAAAGDGAWRLGVAAQQLWRQVSAHCTVAPDNACIHLGPPLLCSHVMFLLRHVLFCCVCPLSFCVHGCVLQISTQLYAVVVSDVVNVVILFLFIIITLIIDWLLCWRLHPGVELADEHGQHQERP